MEEIAVLQREIKFLIAKLGWSQNRLARELYTALNNWDDEDEIQSFQERLKKELQRKTTKTEKLKKYILIIIRHPEAQKIDVIANQYVGAGYISHSLEDGMAKISESLDRSLASETFNKAWKTDA
ncbi:hypothetical protein [Marinobacter sp.]|uniref:hypothetical protein n=1 Tax=Marinobacter sp. TaxID=50741 RepID=UPI002B26C777|nr:hypothetical protein [Marinobacter sp.]